MVEDVGEVSRPFRYTDRLAKIIEAGQWNFYRYYSPKNRKNHFIRGNKVKREEVLEKLAAGELTVDEAGRLLADTDQPKRGSLYCKVSQKGALSVYGLQRMPVTLYVEQWERLLGFADEIMLFAKEHEGELSRKKSS
jgi:hypothetical protein